MFMGPLIGACNLSAWLTRMGVNHMHGHGSVHALTTLTLLERGEPCDIGGMVQSDGTLPCKAQEPSVRVHV